MKFDERLLIAGDICWTQLLEREILLRWNKLSSCLCGWITRTRKKVRQSDDPSIWTSFCRCQRLAERSVVDKWRSIRNHRCDRLAKIDFHLNLFSFYLAGYSMFDKKIQRNKENDSDEPSLSFNEINRKNQLILACFRASFSQLRVDRRTILMLKSSGDTENMRRSKNK